METTRIILARHGQTDYNKALRLQGQIDIPLNPAGERQAQVLGRTLEELAPDLIIASPLTRALATAHAVADRLGEDVRTDPALIERGFGDWEGLTREEIRAGWPELHAEWIAHRPVLGAGVESRTAVAERVGGFCRDLAVQNPGATVLVVAHGAAITLGITGLLELDPESFRGIGGLENCHRSTIAVPVEAGRTGPVRLLSHNIGPDFA
ncbi:histidine phosphatase family protein [Brachybacterium hainanense]|uniref:Histidine phosphatase family protein n=1 Tax=Brachybacterium hainanense TaxID=1541174 RepID=A0ABV6R9W7_9MICO